MLQMQEHRKEFFFGCGGWGARCVTGDNILDIYKGTYITCHFMEVYPFLLWECVSRNRMRIS
jgi:hypothetical protein